MKTILLSICVALSVQSFCQNIGIGISVPGGKVQINHRSSLSFPGIFLMDSADGRAGNIRFRNLSSSAFMEIYGFSSSTLHSALQFLHVRSDSLFVATFRGNGNVGIGTLSPQQRLDVIGNIRSSALSGTGNRPVYVDNSGVLYTEATSGTGITNLSAKAFTKNNSSTASTLISMEYRVYLNVGTSDNIGANISLPHGATITQLKVILLDNSMFDLRISLNYAIIDEIGFHPIAEIISSGTSASEQILTDALSHTVNNSTHFYTVTIRPAVGDFWDGPLLYVRGVVVSYTY